MVIVTLRVRRRPARGARIVAWGLLCSTLLLSGESAAAESPAASEAPSSVPLSLDPVAAHSSWFQLDERSSGRAMLSVGRVTGPAHTVGIVAGATLVHNDAGAPAVLAWRRTRRGSDVRRVFADGSTALALTSPTSIGAATASGDGRWLLWATEADDGTIAGVFRRRMSQHARQRIERLSGRLPFRPGHIVADERGENVVVQGSGPEANMGVVLVRPGAAPVDLPLTDWQVIGMTDGWLVAGTPAGDGTAGPPFAFTDLARLATTTVEADPGGHALVTADGTLAWESTDDAGRRVVMTLGGPDSDPRILRAFEPDAEPDLHLVGATRNAGVGPEGWLGLFLDGRPYHASTADHPDLGGLFIRLDGAGAARVAPIAPPILEGHRWTPVLRPHGAVSIDSVTRTPAGLLAVGWVVAPRQRVLWSSRDGRRWTRRPLTIPRDVPLGDFRIFARGHRVVLAAGERRQRRPNHVRIWTSTDGGSTWRSVPPGPAFGVGPTTSIELRRASAWASDVGWLDGRFAVTGMFCVESCERPTLWTSRDLVTWTRTPLRPRIGGRLLNPIRLSLGHQRVLLTAWNEGPDDLGPLLASSRDGRTWTDHGHLPGDPFPHLVDGRRGFTLVGRATDSGPLTIWRSVDDRTWEPVYQDPYSWGVRDVVATGTGPRRSIVIVGIAMVDPTNEDYQNASLVSWRGGDWVRSVGWMAPPNSTANHAQFLDARTVVALGWSDGARLPAAWRTEFAP